MKLSVLKKLFPTYQVISSRPPWVPQVKLQTHYQPFSELVSVLLSILISTPALWDIWDSWACTAEWDIVFLPPLLLCQQSILANLLTLENFLLASLRYSTLQVTESTTPTGLNREKFAVYQSPGELLISYKTWFRVQMLSLRSNVPLSAPQFHLCLWCWCHLFVVDTLVPPG